MCLKNAFKTHTFCCVIAFTQLQGILDRVLKIMTGYRFELQRTSVICVHSYSCNYLVWFSHIKVLIRCCYSLVLGYIEIFPILRSASIVEIVSLNGKYKKRFLRSTFSSNSNYWWNWNYMPARCLDCYYFCRTFWFAPFWLKLLICYLR